MDRRNFLKTASSFALLAAGSATGIDRVFARQTPVSDGFVPYCPLGRAFLTGVIDENSRFYEGDRRWNLPQFTPEALKHNMPLVALVREWAQRKGVTPAQLAMIWMLSRKPWIAPIPGTTNPAHLDDLLGAGTARLSAWEMEESDQTPLNPANKINNFML